MRKCKVIAVTNQKGGVGKTTTTANVAIGLERYDYKVLIVDFDSQGDLTTSLGWKSNDALECSVSNLLDAYINDKEINYSSLILKHKEDVDVIPANIELADMDIRLVSVINREQTLSSCIEPLRDDYDFNMVVSQPNGLPCSQSLIRKGLEIIEKDANLPHVVFHSLRHTSTTYKLKLNHGDIKAAQGDTGHAQADMVMDLYSHILDKNRKVNAQKFEDGFYRQHMENYEEPKLTSKKLDVDAVLEKIKQDPELLSQLIDILNKD